MNPAWVSGLDPPDVAMPGGGGSGTRTPMGSGEVAKGMDGTGMAGMTITSYEMGRSRSEAVRSLPEKLGDFTEFSARMGEVLILIDQHHGLRLA